MLTNKKFITADGQLTVAAKSFWVWLAFIVPFVHAHLMIFRYNRTVQILKKIAAFMPNEPVDEPADADRFVLEIRRMIRRFKDKYPLSGNCLSRSLTIWLLFRLQGLETSLHIGTRCVKGEFQAHAWVDYKSRHLNAGRLVTDRYTIFEHDFVK